jgi:selT/selW/selH-like putative selenoprotein
LKRAASLAEEILEKEKMNLDRVAIVPLDGGRFEISIDGKLVFSKLAEERFPENEEIIALL